MSSKSRVISLARRARRLGADPVSALAVAGLAALLLFAPAPAFTPAMTSPTLSPAAPQADAPAGDG